MIYIDTREKKWEHIKHYFDSHNIDYAVKKMDTADYSNPEYPKIIIDRKANLQEVCTNLQSGKENYHRFLNECKRAYYEQMRLIILVEGTNCQSIADVCNWNSKYTAHTGRWLANQMHRLSLMYKVEWMFCRKYQTAETIVRLLHGLDKT